MKHTNRERHLQLLFLLFLKKRGMLATETGFTCAGRSDGGGAQIQAIMSIWVFCKTYGFRYYHTPLATLDHAQPEAGALEWEELFGLGEGEKLATESDLKSLQLHQFLWRPWLWKRPTLIRVNHLHEFPDSNAQYYLPYRMDLRKRFKSAPASVSQRNVEIAIHIRRGDVSDPKSERYTKNDELLALIEVLQQQYLEAKRRIRITIYSQGEIGEFQRFSELDCKLALNGNPLETMRELVNADILVMAKSSFSYVAALLCQGQIIYEPFWHKQLPHWHLLADVLKGQVPFASPV